MDQRKSRDETEKRFACNRCHTQKLRCLRNENRRAEEDVCVRCERANAQCVYSPSERLGRPPALDKSRGKVRQKSPKRKHQQLESEPDEDASIRKPAGKTSAPHRGNANQRSRQDFQPTRETRISLADVTFNESESLSNGLSDKDLHLHTGDHEFWASTTLDPYSLELYTPISTPVLPTYSYHSPNLQGLEHAHSSSTSNIMPAHFEDDYLIQMLDPDAHVHMHGTTPGNSPQPLLSTAADYRQAHNAGQERQLAIAPSEVKEECMHRLSNMTMKLSKELKLVLSGCSVGGWCSPSSNHVSLDSSALTTSENQQTTPIGETFRMSQELIQILDLFKPISGSAPPTPEDLKEDFFDESSQSSWSTGANDHVPSQGLQLATGDPLTGGRKTTPAPSASALGSYQPLTPPSSPDLLELDIPVMLLILTCYIRLTRIYGVFFTHCMEILTRYPLAADRTFLPDILPSLDLAGFRPSHWGDLQISIIVEASMYMLNRIERCLARSENTGSETPDTVVQLMSLVLREEGLETGASVKELKQQIRTIKELIQK